VAGFQIVSFFPLWRRGTGEHGDVLRGSCWDYEGEPDVILYRLPFVLHAPSEEGERCMAEIPSLPGCRAWGETPAQTLEYLQSVATAVIEAYRQRGQPLPREVREAAIEVSSDQVSGEVMVAG